MIEEFLLPLLLPFLVAIPIHSCPLLIEYRGISVKAWRSQSRPPNGQVELQDKNGLPFQMPSADFSHG